MAGRKSKYSSENSNTKGTKIWSVAVYIRLSQEDSDNGEDKQESNSITSQKALFVNVNIKMYKFLKIRMYKSVHFYFQLFPFFSFASINLSFNL